MASRTDIPIHYVGKIMALVNLKTQSMNNKICKVISWDESRERFLVKMLMKNDTSMKFIKPANLIETFKSGNEFEDFTKSEDFDDIEQGQDLWNSIDAPTREDFIVKSGWLIKIIKNNNCENFNLLNHVRGLYYELLECCEFPDACIEIKMSLLQVLKSMTPYEDCRNEINEILDECIENHYGYLPTLFAFVPGYNLSFKDKVKIYRKCKTLIENRLHVIGSDTIFLDISFKLFASIWENVTSLNPMKEIVQELFDIRSKIELRDNVNDELIYYFAVVDFLDRKYTEALKKCMRAQKYHASICKGEEAVYTVVRLQFYCYFYLKNKRMTKRCLKEIKKYNLANDIWVLQVMLDSLNSTGIKDETFERRSVAKCSYFKCKNVESRPLEFQLCKGCQLAAYCSRKCQKRHWKNGHSQQCTYRASRGKN